MRHPWNPTLQRAKGGPAYSEKTLAKRTTTDRMANTPGRRNHLFLRMPAVIQSPDAAIRHVNTCNGRMLASSLLAAGRANSTHVSKNTANPVQPAEVHAALWVSVFIVSTPSCGRTILVREGSAPQNACCPSRKKARWADEITVSINPFAAS